MYGFPKTTQGAIRSAWKRAVYTTLAGQTVFVLPALSDARVALRVWSSATTPPTLLNAYQVRAAIGEQCFVAGAMTITSAYANPEAMYDGSTATSAGTTGWPNTVTVDWGTPRHISRADLFTGTNYNYGVMWVATYQWAGSNDGTNWAWLATVTNNVDSWVTASFDSAVAYRYYRYTSLTQGGDGLGTPTNPIYELAMYPLAARGALSAVVLDAAVPTGTRVVIEYAAL